MVRLEYTERTSSNRLKTGEKNERERDKGKLLHLNGILYAFDCMTYLIEMLRIMKANISSRTKSNTLNKNLSAGRKKPQCAYTGTPMPTTLFKLRREKKTDKSKRT